MVWKGVTKVGFGVSGKYVVAWYCETPGVLENPNESLKNVGKVCYKHGYNQCYNELAITAHNKMRKNHKAEALSFDEDAARAIQHELNRADFSGEMPKTTERATTFAGCGQAIFYQDDSTKMHEVSTTNIATDEWYSGISDYDFDANAPKTVVDTDYIEEAGECRLSVNLLEKVADANIVKTPLKDAKDVSPLLCAALTPCEEG